VFSPDPAIASGSDTDNADDFSEQQEPWKGLLKPCVDLRAAQYNSMSSKVAKLTTVQGLMEIPEPLGKDLSLGLQVFVLRCTVTLGSVSQGQLDKDTPLGIPMIELIQFM